MQIQRFSIQISKSNEAEKVMNLFNNFYKKTTAATLVQQGLANQATASSKQIKDCIVLLANGLGESWKSASKEAAAGMVLVALAKNDALKNYLNNNGWNLVLNFVHSNPKIAKAISPRTMGEIFSYQASAPQAMLAAI
jgi:hypothetical protein